MIGFAGFGISRLSKFQPNRVGARSIRHVSRRLAVLRKMKYLNAETAAAVDESLMGEEVGFTLEQLMELAGLAVAQALVDFVKSPQCSVIVVAGPGNNGGDGLVAARHLKQFGYKVQVLYPKQGRNEHYSKLRKQLDAEKVEFISEFTPADVILDSIFGFSFKGTVRDPFREVISSINSQQSSKVVCVDVPSGWDVDGREPDQDSVRIENPDCVISLTAPKVSETPALNSNSISSLVLSTRQT